MTFHITESEIRKVIDIMVEGDGKPGGAKIEAIKYIRGLSNIYRVGLKEAKEAVEFWYKEGLSGPAPAGFSIAPPERLAQEAVKLMLRYGKAEGIE